jgi:hypothetical protein
MSGDTVLAAVPPSLLDQRLPIHGWPGEFIPLAERTGLMGPLTHYVLDAAVRQCRDWRLGGVELSVAVNVSARRLLDLGFPDEVADLPAWQVPAPWLVLELTESAIMADPDRALEPNGSTVVTRRQDSRELQAIAVLSAEVRALAEWSYSVNRESKPQRPSH